ncbi:MAG: tyrosine-type recombinase/integrase [Eubacterium sp.]
MAKTKKQVKNEKGEGSFRKRSNGTFEYRIVYTDEYNETKRKSFYGQSDIICMEKAEKFLYDLEKKKSGIDIDASIPDIAKEKAKSDFDKNYTHEQGYARNLYTISIIEKSAIGKTPIAELSESQVDLFFRTLTKYSNSTIVKVYRQIRIAFRIAYDKGIISKDFMQSGNMKCPKSNKATKKVSALTKDEQKRFVEYLENYEAPKGRNEYVLQLLISLYSGMRMGEVNALKPENIDFKAGVIKVRSTVSRGKDYTSFIKDGTKTYAGIRDIPIMDNLKIILKSALEKKSDNPYDLIFYDNVNDKIITTSQVNSFFQRICDKCNIESHGQHALRHTFATRCIEADVPAVVLKTWLGHTDIHITLDTYADVFNSMHNDSITKLDNYINNLSKVG